MTELLTAAQMRAIEAAAIRSGDVTGLELMERAGRGVVEAIFEEWPELRATSHRAVVLCGPGNNGGDGFVVARVLKEWGWKVELFLYGDAEKLPPDARVNYERWWAMGEVQSAELFAPWDTDSDVYIDALFGTGLTRQLEGTAAKAAKDFEASARNHRARLVAVDLPSGVCSDSGRSLGQSLVADLTVTFAFKKWGHFLAQGPEYCGKVVCCDIGIANNAPGKVLGTPYSEKPKQKADYSAIVTLETASALRPGFSGPRSFLDKGWADLRGHKFTHGHALILSGGIATGGAARLAARGALRIGAGVVTLGCPSSAMMVNAAQLNAIMLRRIGDGAALAHVLEDARINALCLGPGLGLERGEMVAAALDAGHGNPRSTVLDADALTILAANPALFAMLHDRCILTPHAGEFARLFPDIAAKLAEPATKGPAYSKVDATREAAKRAGCVVLFKGADTVIAAPDGRCSINAAVYDRAAPWLATAGSGDVLAGFITGLLARGFDPMQAAETAAWLHLECARSFGPGLIAEDLPEELPKAFRALGM